MNHFGMMSLSSGCPSVEREPASSPVSVAFPFTAAQVAITEANGYKRWTISTQESSFSHEKEGFKRAWLSREDIAPGTHSKHTLCHAHWESSTSYNLRKEGRASSRELLTKGTKFELAEKVLILSDMVMWLMLCHVF